MKIKKTRKYKLIERKVLLVRLLFLVCIVFAAATLSIVAQTTDTDADGVPDYRDNCPNTFNPEKIVYTDGRADSEIYVMNPNGSNPANLTNNPAFDADPAFSHDGTKIAFMSVRNNNADIYVMKADGSNPTRLTDNPATDRDPSFSPDGSKIVFSSDRDGNIEVYVMNSDGSDQTRLTFTMADENEPAFSPDGSKIVFASQRNGNSEIYVMNADGSAQIDLTNNPALDQAPSFSPDGSKITFTTDRDGNYEVYIMNADGTIPIDLTNNSGYDAQSSFSPNGGRITFQSQRTGGFEIYTMNADGSALSRITDLGNALFEPRWGAQPDSDHDGIGDACDNTAPVIETFDLTRQRGSSYFPVAIAQVFDPDETIRTMTFTVNGSQSATVNGVTISNIDNSLGIDILRARVSVACNARNASFTLRVTDSGGLSGQETLHVTVLADAGPPIIYLRPGGLELFPPDHKYDLIRVNQMVASVRNNCSILNTANVVIKKVTSDEPDDGPGAGDGNTVNDIVIAHDCRSVWLRAERDGNRNGRVYTITLSVDDATGNSTTQEEFEISVPKNHNGSPAIRDAAAMTITSDCL